MAARSPGTRHVKAQLTLHRPNNGCRLGHIECVSGVPHKPRSCALKSCCSAIYGIYGIWYIIVKITS